MRRSGVGLFCGRVVGYGAADGELLGDVSVCERERGGGKKGGLGRCCLY